MRCLSRTADGPRPQRAANAKRMESFYMPFASHALRARDRSRPVGRLICRGGTPPSYDSLFRGLFLSRWKLKLLPLRLGRTPPLNGASLMNFRFGSMVFGRALGTRMIGQPS